MANTTAFPLDVKIVGDNVSTSVVVNLGFTPAAAALISAYNSDYGNVSANISSVVPGSSNITINFVTAFTGTISVQLALSSATYVSAHLQPVTGTFWQATQPVSGTTTANAGTNLNTSALALESGGNLAAIKADTDKIPSQGQALAAASMPVVLTAAQITTLTPPAVFGGVVTQVTGLNLHTVVDSGTITTVSTVTTVSAARIVGNAGATLDAAVGTLPTNSQAVINVPTAGAGGALSAVVKAAQATAVNIKASAGNLYGFAIVSATATAGFVMFFNTATTATTGAIWAIPIAASGTVIVPPSVLALLNFSSGIAINVASPINGTTTQITWTGTIMFL